MVYLHHMKKINKEFFVEQLQRAKKLWKKILEKIETADYVYQLAGLVFLVGSILLVWFGGRYAWSFRQGIHLQSGVASVSSEQSVSGACPYRRVLDGLCVAEQSSVNPRVVGVMVENSRDAWPLSGLSKASVVYEAPAESNIPRFLALYPADTAVDKVGPVRSSRPYYLDWLGEYGNPLYLHVGGSPEALADIVADNIFDMNEFNHGWYYWRADDREAPHNAYTSSNLWQKALDDSGAVSPATSYDSFLFATSTVSCVNNCAGSVTVTFSSPMYASTWQYATSTGQYTRLVAGTPVADSDGSVIVADTVIVEQIQATVLDEVGRKQVTTIGSGTAMIFHDGAVISGSWSKSDRTSRTQYRDAAGNEIPLKPGKIWVEMVPQNGAVTWR